ncbi:MAG: hypothetical protein KDA93_13090 [Planctomycetaceae bacterium]|nr:hypothetical protein [Planctomycetaceae bacterium]
MLISPVPLQKPRRMKNPALRNGSGDTRQRPKVVLYSHDTMGIGHMRRNLLIAQSLKHGPHHASVLMVAGAPEACAMTATSGIDCLALPALSKDSNGEYASRHQSMSYRSMLNFRSRTIRAAVEEFAPDVMIVDKVPSGVGGELSETLSTLRESSHTKVVLGLRDVLDDRKTVQSEWREADGDAVVQDFFDAVWVYGDHFVFDTLLESGFDTGVMLKSCFTGYLDQRSRLRFHQQELVPASNGVPIEFDERLIVAVVGGGQDGAALSRAFCQSELPKGTQGVLLTGPCMPEGDRQELRRLAQRNGRVRVIEQLVEADFLIEAADRVIAMGGYNTVCSILSFGKPALIVPRVHPRREQLIRAQRMANHGLIDYLHPDGLSADALTTWMQADVSRLTSLEHTVDLNGLGRINQLFGDLIDPHVRPSSFVSKEKSPHVL